MANGGTGKSLRDFLLLVATDAGFRRRYIEATGGSDPSPVGDFLRAEGFELDADHQRILSERPLRLERVRAQITGTFSGSPETTISIIWDIPIIW